MQLHELRAPKGSRTKKVRIGRGPASGLGKQSGKGDKGQRSRSGNSIMLGSEGGQMPLIRRLPKVGFNTSRPIVYQVVQLDSLNFFDANATVNANKLKEAKLISSSRRPYKILSRGELTKVLTVQANAFSAEAFEKINRAGGKAEIVGKRPEPKPKAKKVKK
ncbi:MAG: 50S ribosomal protein L15 [Candidatus Omnitrophica bacterium]|nr:50S ribosomal protein L15 [Candidatus Omnitrophota bacterium]